MAKLGPKICIKRRVTWGRMDSDTSHAEGSVRPDSGSSLLTIHNRATWLCSVVRFQVPEYGYDEIYKKREE